MPNPPYQKGPHRGSLQEDAMAHVMTRPLMDAFKPNPHCNTLKAQTWGPHWEAQKHAKELVEIQARLKSIEQKLDRLLAPSPLTLTAQEMRQALKMIKASK